MTAVYVMSVEGQKLCKIGWSKWPRTRLKDMGSSYTTPHGAKLKLEYMRDCGIECRLVEQRALELLTDKRTAPKREWVTVEPQEAICAIRKAARQLGVKLRKTAALEREREKPIRKLVEIPGSLWKQIDEFRWETRCPTETEAFRRLLRFGLDAHNQTIDNEKRGSRE